jgi:hypothetical protein
MARRRGQAANRPAGRGGTVLLALAAGLAGGMLAPLLFPSAARGARPAAKSAVKAALAVYERSREIAAEFGETASDIIAEARAEFADERRAKLARLDPGAAGDVVALHMTGTEPRNA